MLKPSRWQILFCAYFPFENYMTPTDPSVFQLEILDTAGADQFHTLNERHIKVAALPLKRRHT